MLNNSLDPLIDGNYISISNINIRNYSFKFKFDEVDQAASVPVLNSANINDMILDLSNDFFSINPTIVTFDNINFVSSINDLPPVIGNVITLAADNAYIFTADVDLLGNRLVCAGNVSIVGTSSETSSIYSTGLIGTALITSTYSLPMRDISLTADLVLDLDGNFITTALDWTAVNFVNCANIGTIKNQSNFIMSNSAFLNSCGMIFDGNIGTISAFQTLFNTNTGQTAITLLSTCVVSRRFRITYSSFVTLVGETSLNISASATIPVESYILNTCNFSGGGTYITGVQYNDNKSAFNNNVGILNSGEFAYYYMNNNGTATTINNTTTPVKVNGTTTLSSLTQRFTHTNNKITYIGAISRMFKITVTVTVTGGNNNIIKTFVAKDGTVIPNSVSSTTLTGSAGTRIENITNQIIVDLATNNYLEVFIQNTSSVTNLTVTDLSVIVEALN
jgi:hypothetical protein